MNVPNFRVVLVSSMVDQPPIQPTPFQTMNAAKCPLFLVPFHGRYRID